MSIDVQETHEWAILTPSEANFDVHVVPRFREEVNRLVDRDRPKILIDLRNVLHVDTAGLGAMVFALRLVEGKGTVVLCGVHQPLLSLLKTTGLDRVFRVVDSVEALASSSPEPCRKDKQHTTG